MCYVYSKLRAFLERDKASPKEPMGVIFFILPQFFFKCLFKKLNTKLTMCIFAHFLHIIPSF